MTTTSSVNKSYTLYAEVILDLSIQKTLDYGVPLEFISQIKPGMRVQVPIRGQLRKGTVFKLKNECYYPKVSPVYQLISEEEVIQQDLFELAVWMAKYYCTPLSQVIKSILPSPIRKDMQHKQQLYVTRKKTREELRLICMELRKEGSPQAAILDVMLKVKKGILLSELLEKAQVSRSPVETLVKKNFIELNYIQLDRSPFMHEDYFRTKPKVLNEQQQLALDDISGSLQKHIFKTHLLYGITGSGKTEVYLQAIEKSLALGRGIIMLVPEISLTAQTIERFRSRFDHSIAILHYQLSDGERFDMWHKIRRGECRIVIGARSAIFSPVPNLGLIIVDEEHESSYKQSEESPCYHARNVAVMRGYLNKSTVILGSATPSLESYYNCQTGKYVLNNLSIRAETSALPEVKIVDMKIEQQKAQGYTLFSELLLNGIKERQKKGEQIIIFLNRRGYHTTLVCQSCGHTIVCPHCDVSLTFHLSDNHLACHLCGYCLKPPPKECTKCHSAETMRYKGFGTEHVERALHAIFPDIRTLRLDADTTRHKGSHEQIFRAFRTGKADLLIGTQMVAKGLHFPAVTLVGVLNSDASINIPDFRSAETAFQLITQISGRAGRGALAGEVILQTYMPENDVIQLAAKQDFIGFYEKEIRSRELFAFPPFLNIIKINFSGVDPLQIQEVAKKLRNTLLSKLSEAFQVHPVIPCGHAKIKDLYRFQFLIRGPSVYNINQSIESALTEINIPSNIKLHIDVDPTSTFF
ncbi:MAG: priA [Chlamydiales bacterium]|jgi:primosomal protein N' (replication factor Y)|nr:priA [Chlamydiales bacterium]